MVDVGAGGREDATCVGTLLGVLLMVLVRGWEAVDDTDDRCTLLPLTENEFEECERGGMATCPWPCRELERCMSVEEAGERGDGERGERGE